MLQQRSGSVLVAAIVAGTAAAATLDTLEVGREDGVYSLHSETRLSASPEAIRAVLTDYENFDRISSAYKDFGYLETEPDGTPIIFTRMEGCVLFFCKSMTRVERLEVNSPEHIRTVTLPERSDFKRSVSEWLIEQRGDVTHVVYTLEMEPDFWVPPVIGPWYLKKTLRRGGGAAIDRIEKLAQELDASGQGA
jgi:hypothetical protein